MPGLIKACSDREALARIIDLIYCDDLFASNPVMATCKAMSVAGSDVSHSSIVTVMARNGTEFGIKVSGLGNQWFTELAEIGRGTLAAGLWPSDVNRDMGDSAITETMGLGGTIKSTLGSSKDATDITLKTYGITESESDIFKVPSLDGRGSPMGFDILKIVDKNIRPAVNSGFAQRHINRPSAGAGALHAPMEAFVNAAIAFADAEF